MCQRLNVSSSGYYAWCGRPPSQRSLDNRVMTERIRQIHQMSDCTYGRDRIQAELRERGLQVNHKRIERLMLGMYPGRQSSPWRRGDHAA